jgi:hypothetical protein
MEMDIPCTFPYVFTLPFRLRSLTLLAALSTDELHTATISNFDSGLCRYGRWALAAQAPGERPIMPTQIGLMVENKEGARKKKRGS